MRDDLSLWSSSAPSSLLQYVADIRRHSLDRKVDTHGRKKVEKLPRNVAVGMIPKKIHEVGNFADFIVRTADDIKSQTGNEITHFVDFGSGQNYLGRTLASPIYGKNVVAVESREHNIQGAKGMDVLAGVAEREVVMRNKKLFRMQQDSLTPEEMLKDKEKRRKAKIGNALEKRPERGEVDLRPSRELTVTHSSNAEEGRGFIQYVEHVVRDGDLSDVVVEIERLKSASPVDVKVVTSETTGTILEVATSTSTEPNRPTRSLEILSTIQEAKDKPTRLMAMSIHSCGNLSHHGIRSLILNPSVSAIAIVGCCYNLLTSRLGPPTFKTPSLATQRQNLRAINVPRLDREDAAECDPHGFPMSNRITTYGSSSEGIRLNITARMMACQAPQNWTEKESDSFFTRHFYRALLQRVFLDKGVVSIMPDNSFPERGTSTATPESTEPVIIGSLRKSCYDNFVSYVRGALHKLSANPDPERAEQSKLVGMKIGDITDEEIDDYFQRYKEFKKELSVVWSFMAFSASVVESLIVVDRWLWLIEHGEEMRDAWVEAVWDYEESPRNLVVVGLKK